MAKQKKKIKKEKNKKSSNNKYNELIESAFEYALYRASNRGFLEPNSEEDFYRGVEEGLKSEKSKFITAQKKVCQKLYPTEIARLGKNHPGVSEKDISTIFLLLASKIENSEIEDTDMQKSRETICRFAMLEMLDSLQHNEREDIINLLRLFYRSNEEDIRAEGGYFAIDMSHNFEEMAALTYVMRHRAEDECSKKLFNTVLQGITKRDKKNAINAYIQSFEGLLDLMVAVYQTIFNHLSITTAEEEKVNLFYNEGIYCPKGFEKIVDIKDLKELRSQTEEDRKNHVKLRTLQLIIDIFGLLSSPGCLKGMKGIVEFDLIKEHVDSYIQTLNFNKISLGLLFLEEERTTYLLYTIMRNIKLMLASLAPWHIASDVELPQMDYRKNLNYANVPIYKEIGEPTLKSEEEDLYVYETTAQRIFAYTGIIVPRATFFDFDSESFRKLKEEDGEKVAILMQLIASISFHGALEREWREGCYGEIIKECKSNKCEVKEEDKDINELKEEIRDLKNELKRVNSYLKSEREARHDKDIEAKINKEELNTLKREIESDKEELKYLREVIFDLQKEEDKEDIEDIETIEFPVELDKKIVVYGGHPTWLKGIKPLLPTVTFADPYELVNSERIKNADIVYIQTNALEHHNFYTVINEAKKSKVKVRYMMHTGYKKCAEQIVSENC